MRKAEMRRKDELELRIERALEAVPEIAVQEDFAARVAAEAKAMRPGLPEDTRWRALGVGRRLTWALAAFLLLAILALAPGAHGMRFWVAFALELDFAALALGLSLRGLRV